MAGPTAEEVAILKKAKEAEEKRETIRFTGKEAETAHGMITSGNKTWGPYYPHPHRPFGPGPYVRGWYDGGDIIASGITAAGLMVLDHMLNPPEPPPPPPPEYEDQGRGGPPQQLEPEPHQKVKEPSGDPASKVKGADE